MNWCLGPIKEPGHSKYAFWRPSILTWNTLFPRSRKPENPIQSISSEQGDEEGTVDCVEEAFSEGEEENSAEHHHHHHDSYDHAPCYGCGITLYQKASIFKRIYF